MKWGHLIADQDGIFAPSGQIRASGDLALLAAVCASIAEP
jgi:hypothetical protein